MKKGIVELGVTVITAIIVTVVAVSGALFTAANPIGSAVFLTAAAGTAYSQTTHVKRKFRERKAIGMCEVSGTENCTSTVKEWSDEDVLDYIRDDAPGTPTGRGDDVFIAVGMLPRLGG